ncbi:hypothetical protein VP1G_11050 [Cytospora mali]|uniref:Uncharacterized protein n=1 Tax=Cytospora mali TaxID=578113 RepID=A0A194V4Z3_CYTMA|nr:hypothetical protein VP1G_11050 [Valsa mali var. pyri (nom. inval.)]
MRIHRHALRIIVHLHDLGPPLLPAHGSPRGPDSSILRNRDALDDALAQPHRPTHPRLGAEGPEVAPLRLARVVVRLLAEAPRDRPPLDGAGWRAQVERDVAVALDGREDVAREGEGVWPVWAVGVYPFVAGEGLVRGFSALADGFDVEDIIGIVFGGGRGRFG